jgi:hypothetical protein
LGSQSDNDFLLSFEEGNPAWDNSEYHAFQNYPSIQWKQLNINKFRQDSPTKHKLGIEKLMGHFENIL